MSAHNVLPWRPKNTVAIVADPELLWTMRKRDWRIDCTLQNCGRNGWTIQVMLNGHAFFSGRSSEWADAIESAEEKYAELVRGGWTPVALSLEEQHRPL